MKVQALVALVLKAEGGADATGGGVGLVSDAWVHSQVMKTRSGPFRGSPEQLPTSEGGRFHALARGLAGGLLAIWCLAPLGGCAAETQGRSYLELAPARYEAAFGAACEVLRSEGMSPQVADRGVGRIETDPRSAPSLFEPWAWGEVTAEEAVEGTFGFERRRVLVEFMRVGETPALGDPSAPLVGPSLPGAERGASVPVELDSAHDRATSGAAPIEMRVTVSVERRFKPGRQTSAYTRALGGYAVDVTLDPTDAPRDRSVWTPVARDERLERLIVEEVRRRLAESSSATPAP